MTAGRLGDIVILTGFVIIDTDHLVHKFAFILVDIASQPQAIEHAVHR